MVNRRGNPSGYTIQTTLALIIFILGLLLLVIWVILYTNRLNNNITPEWWIWLFLGFGIFFILVGLIWLIVIQYLVGGAAIRMYMELCDHDDYCREGETTKEEREEREVIRSGRDLPGRRETSVFSSTRRSRLT